MSGVILIVDDEADLVSTLAYNFQSEGYETRCALTGQEAIDRAEESPTPDLILLDLMLPDMSGTEVCRLLKANPKTKNVPILMLTARGGEIDRVVGFEVGADDYVVKPFSVRELQLRVRAVLRRAQSPQEETRDIVFGCLRLDSEGHRAWVHEEPIDLTALEFKLLRVLLDRKGRVQTRNVLLGDVWGIDADVTTRTVDTHIKRLRQKLGKAGDYIETLRGVGYRFQAAVDETGH